MRAVVVLLVALAIEGLAGDPPTGLTLKKRTGATTVVEEEARPASQSAGSRVRAALAALTGSPVELHLFGNVVLAQYDEEADQVVLFWQGEAAVVPETRHKWGGLGADVRDAILRHALGPGGREYSDEDLLASLNGSPVTVQDAAGRDVMVVPFDDGTVRMTPVGQTPTAPTQRLHELPLEVREAVLEIAWKKATETGAPGGSPSPMKPSRTLYSMVRYGVKASTTLTVPADESDGSEDVEISTVSLDAKLMVEPGRVYNTMDTTFSVTVPVSDATPMPAQTSAAAAEEVAPLSLSGVKMLTEKALQSVVKAAKTVSGAAVAAVAASGAGAGGTTGGTPASAVDWEAPSGSSADADTAAFKDRLAVVYPHVPLPRGASVFATRWLRGTPLAAEESVTALRLAEQLNGKRGEWARLDAMPMVFRDESPIRTMRALYETLALPGAPASGTMGRQQLVAGVKWWARETMRRAVAVPMSEYAPMSAEDDRVQRERVRRKARAFMRSRGLKTLEPEDAHVDDIEAVVGALGRTAVMLACRSHDASVLAAVLRDPLAKATLEAGLQDLNGASAAHLCAQYGTADMVGAVVEVTPARQLVLPDLDGYTPLMTACRYGSSASVEHVAAKLRRGLNDQLRASLMGYTTPDGETALQLCTVFNDKAAVQAVLEATPSQLAALAGHALPADAAPVISDPLVYACAYGTPDMLGSVYHHVDAAVGHKPEVGDAAIACALYNTREALEVLAEVAERGGSAVPSSGAGGGDPDDDPGRGSDVAHSTLPIPLGVLNCLRDPSLPLLVESVDALESLSLPATGFRSLSLSLSPHVVYDGDNALSVCSRMGNTPAFDVAVASLKGMVESFKSHGGDAAEEDAGEVDADPSVAADATATDGTADADADTDADADADGSDDVDGSGSGGGSDASSARVEPLPDRVLVALTRAYRGFTATSTRLSILQLAAAARWRGSGASAGTGSEVASLRSMALGALTGLIRTAERGLPVSHVLRVVAAAASIAGEREFAFLSSLLEVVGTERLSEAVGKLNAQPETAHHPLVAVAQSCAPDLIESVLKAIHTVFQTTATRTGEASTVEGLQRTLARVQLHVDAGESEDSSAGGSVSRGAPSGDVDGTTSSGAAAATSVSSADADAPTDAPADDVASLGPSTSKSLLSYCLHGGDAAAPSTRPRLTGAMLLMAAAGRSGDEEAMAEIMSAVAGTSLVDAARVALTTARDGPATLCGGGGSARDAAYEAVQVGAAELPMCRRACPGTMEAVYAQPVAQKGEPPSRTCFVPPSVLVTEQWCACKDADGTKPGVGSGTASARSPRAATVDGIERPPTLHEQAESFLRHLNAVKHAGAVSFPPSLALGDDFKHSLSPCQVNALGVARLVEQVRRLDSLYAQRELPRVKRAAPVDEHPAGGPAFVTVLVDSGSEMYTEQAGSKVARDGIKAVDMREAAKRGDSKENGLGAAVARVLDEAAEADSGGTTASPGADADATATGMPRRSFMGDGGLSVLVGTGRGRSVVLSEALSALDTSARASLARLDMFAHMHPVHPSMAALPGTDAEELRERCTRDGFVRSSLLGASVNDVAMAGRLASSREVVVENRKGDRPGRAASTGANTLEETKVRTTVVVGDGARGSVSGLNTRLLSDEVADEGPEVAGRAGDSSEAQFRGFTARTEMSIKMESTTSNLWPYFNQRLACTPPRLYADFVQSVHRAGKLHREHDGGRAARRLHSIHISNVINDGEPDDDVMVALVEARLIVRSMSQEFAEKTFKDAAEALAHLRLLLKGTTGKDSGSSKPPSGGKSRSAVQGSSFDVAAVAADEIVETVNVVRNMLAPRRNLPEDAPVHIRRSLHDGQGAGALVRSRLSLGWLVHVMGVEGGGDTDDDGDGEPGDGSDKRPANALIADSAVDVAEESMSMEISMIVPHGISLPRRRSGKGLKPGARISLGRWPSSTPARAVVTSAAALLGQDAADLSLTIQRPRVRDIDSPGADPCADRQAAVDRTSEGSPERIVADAILERCKRRAKLVPVSSSIDPESTATLADLLELWPFTLSFRALPEAKLDVKVATPDAGGESVGVKSDGSGADATSVEAVREARAATLLPRVEEQQAKAALEEQGSSVPVTASDLLSARSLLSLPSLVSELAHVGLTVVEPTLGASCEQLRTMLATATNERIAKLEQSREKSAHMRETRIARLDRADGSLSPLDSSAAAADATVGSPKSVAPPPVPASLSGQAGVDADGETVDDVTDGGDASLLSIEERVGVASIAEADLVCVPVSCCGPRWLSRGTPRMLVFDKRRLEAAQAKAATNDEGTVASAAIRRSADAEALVVLAVASMAREFWTEMANVRMGILGLTAADAHSTWRNLAPQVQVLVAPAGDTDAVMQRLPVGLPLLDVLMGAIEDGNKASLVATTGDLVECAADAAADAAAGSDASAAAGESCTAVNLATRASLGKIRVTVGSKKLIVDLGPPKRTWVHDVQAAAELGVGSATPDELLARVLSEDDAHNRLVVGVSPVAEAFLFVGSMHTRLRMLPGELLRTIYGGSRCDAPDCHLVLVPLCGDVAASRMAVTGFVELAACRQFGVQALRIPRGDGEPMHVFLERWWTAARRRRPETEEGDGQEGITNPPASAGVPQPMTADAPPPPPPSGRQVTPSSSELLEVESSSSTTASVAATPVLFRDVPLRVVVSSFHPLSGAQERSHLPINPIDFLTEKADALLDLPLAEVESTLAEEHLELWANKLLGGIAGVSNPALFVVSSSPDDAGVVDEERCNGLLPLRSTLLGGTRAGKAVLEGLRAAVREALGGGSGVATEPHLELFVLDQVPLPIAKLEGLSGGAAIRPQELEAVRKCVDAWLSVDKDGVPGAGPWPLAPFVTKRSLSKGTRLIHADPVKLTSNNVWAPTETWRRGSLVKLSDRPTDAVRRGGGGLDDLYAGASGGAGLLVRCKVPVGEALLADKRELPTACKWDRDSPDDELALASEGDSVCCLVGASSMAWHDYSSWDEDEEDEDDKEDGEGTEEAQVGSEGEGSGASTEGEEPAADGISDDDAQRAVRGEVLSVVRIFNVPGEGLRFMAAEVPARIAVTVVPAGQPDCGSAVEPMVVRMSMSPSYSVSNLLRLLSDFGHEATLRAVVQGESGDVMRRALDRSLTDLTLPPASLLAAARSSAATAESDGGRTIASRIAPPAELAPDSQLALAVRGEVTPRFGSSRNPLTMELELWTAGKLECEQRRVQQRTTELTSHVGGWVWYEQAPNVWVRSVHLPTMQQLVAGTEHESAELCLGLVQSGHAETDCAGQGEVHAVGDKVWAWLPPARSGAGGVDGGDGDGDGDDGKDAPVPAVVREVVRQSVAAGTDGRTVEAVEYVVELEGATGGADPVRAVPRVYDPIVGGRAASVATVERRYTVGDLVMVPDPRSRPGSPLFRAALVQAVPEGYAPASELRVAPLAFPHADASNDPTVAAGDAAETVAVPVAAVRPVLCGVPRSRVVRVGRGGAPHPLTDRLADLMPVMARPWMGCGECSVVGSGGSSGSSSSSSSSSSSGGGGGSGGVRGFLSRMYKRVRGQDATTASADAGSVPGTAVASLAWTDGARDCSMPAPWVAGLARQLSDGGWGVYAVGSAALVDEAGQCRGGGVAEVTDGSERSGDAEDPVGTGSSDGATDAPASSHASLPAWTTLAPRLVESRAGGGGSSRVALENALLPLSAPDSAADPLGLMCLQPLVAPAALANGWRVELDEGFGACERGHGDGVECAMAVVRATPSHMAAAAPAVVADATTDDGAAATDASDATAAAPPRGTRSAYVTFTDESLRLRQPAFVVPPSMYGVGVPLMPRRAKLDAWVRQQAQQAQQATDGEGVDGTDASNRAGAVGGSGDGSSGKSGDGSYTGDDSVEAVAGAAKAVECGAVDAVFSPLVAGQAVDVVRGEVLEWAMDLVHPSECKMDHSVGIELRHASPFVLRSERLPPRDESAAANRARVAQEVADARAEALRSPAGRRLLAARAALQLDLSPSERQRRRARYRGAARLLRLARAGGAGVGPGTTAGVQALGDSLGEAAEAVGAVPEAFIEAAAAIGVGAVSGAARAGAGADAGAGAGGDDAGAPRLDASTMLGRTAGVPGFTLGWPSRDGAASRWGTDSVHVRMGLGMTADAVRNPTAPASVGQRHELHGALSASLFGYRLTLFDGSLSAYTHPDEPARVAGMVTVAGLRLPAATLAQDAHAVVARAALSSLGAYARFVVHKATGLAAEPAAAEVTAAGGAPLHEALAALATVQALGASRVRRAAEVAERPLAEAVSAHGAELAAGLLPCPGAREAEREFAAAPWRPPVLWSLGEERRVPSRLAAGAASRAVGGGVGGKVAGAVTVLAMDAVMDAVLGAQDDIRRIAHVETAIPVGFAAVSVSLELRGELAVRARVHGCVRTLPQLGDGSVVAADALASVAQHGAGLEPTLALKVAPSVSVGIPLTPIRAGLRGEVDLLRLELGVGHTVRSMPVPADFTVPLSAPSAFVGEVKHGRNTIPTAGCATAYAELGTLSGALEAYAVGFSAELFRWAGPKRELASFCGGSFAEHGARLGSCCYETRGALMDAGYAGALQQALAKAKQADAKAKADAAAAAAAAALQRRLKEGERTLRSADDGFPGLDSAGDRLLPRVVVERVFADEPASWAGRGSDAMFAVVRVTVAPPAACDRRAPAGARVEDYRMPRSYNLRLSPAASSAGDTLVLTPRADGDGLVLRRESAGAGGSSAGTVLVPLTVPPEAMASGAPVRHTAKIWYSKELLGDRDPVSLFVQGSAQAVFGSPFPRSSVADAGAYELIKVLEEEDVEDDGAGGDEAGEDEEEAAEARARVADDPKDMVWLASPFSEAATSRRRLDTREVAAQTVTLSHGWKQDGSGGASPKFEKDTLGVCGQSDVTNAFGSVSAVSESLATATRHVARAASAVYGWFRSWFGFRSTSEALVDARAHTQAGALGDKFSYYYLCGAGDSHVAGGRARVVVRGHPSNGKYEVAITMRGSGGTAPTVPEFAVNFHKSGSTIPWASAGLLSSVSFDGTEQDLHLARAADGAAGEPLLTRTWYMVQCPTGTPVRMAGSSFYCYGKGTSDKDIAFWFEE